MNKSYTLVWNQATGCWNVASEGTRRRSKSGRGKALVVAGASLLGLFCQAPAFALPSGATVVSGDAGFQTSTDGRHMVIDQQSHKLITNWNEFSVRADERVSFHQPGQDAVALNRVIGRNGSDIQGRIDANGKVFLVNPNGVVFGKSAQVNVGGLVASTLDLADRDFLAGNYQFSGDSGATVSNAGSLQASEGGSIALLGARVSNDGVIQAQLGDVALGAGQGINLNFDGDGLLNLQVDKGSVDARTQRRPHPRRWRPGADERPQRRQPAQDRRQQPGHSRGQDATQRGRTHRPRRRRTGDRAGGRQAGRQRHRRRQWRPGAEPGRERRDTANRAGGHPCRPGRNRHLEDSRTRSA